MSYKKDRRLKVYETSGPKYKPTPTIMLKGEWLKELGFDCGDRINVECQGGKLMRSLLNDPLHILLFLKMIKNVAAIDNIE